jgi:hypothetical protein
VVERREPNQLRTSSRSCRQIRLDLAAGSPVAFGPRPAPAARDDFHPQLVIVVGLVPIVPLVGGRC